MSKPTVWFVDEIPDNLEKFRKNHKDFCNVKTFETIDEAKAELDNQQPDALLCDISFFDAALDKIKQKAMIWVLASGILGGILGALFGELFDLIFWL